MCRQRAVGFGDAGEQFLAGIAVHAARTQVVHRNRVADAHVQAAGRIRIQAGGGICADAIRELYPKTGVTAYHMSGKIELASPMQYRKENVNMGLPSLSEYTLYRTDVKAVRSARAVLEEL